MPVIRPLEADDAPTLARLLQRSREFHRPWFPRRPERWFTEEGQRDAVAAALRDREAGTTGPFVIVDGEEVVGTVTLQSVIRGFFQSCSIGYWLDQRAVGHGLATAAVGEAVAHAFDALCLHRVQAETLVDNAASHGVLERTGFTRYGTAPAYLQIAGTWQDCVLWQQITPTPERVELPT